ncbi:MAG: hypothetical protein M3416_04845 [Acidobacteriota bacterium]|nr:hypothetical protein [Acidobacteriota bacterium]
MLKIVRASALVVVLACAARAGETPNHVTGTPTQQPATMTMESAADDSAREMAADSYGEILLNLLEGVLALF